MLVSALSTAYMVVIEVKIIQIDYLDILSAKSTRLQKASALSKISAADKVFELKIAAHDNLPVGGNSKVKRAGFSLKDWIRHPEGPGAQLAQYWNSNEIKEKRLAHKSVAYLVVIVGSRKIILSKLSDDGYRLGELQLVRNGPIS